MAFVALYGFQTSLTAATAAGAGLLEIDPSVAADLSAQLGPGGTSYASLSDGVNYEVVHITGVSLPNMVVVTRGADGTTSFAFPQGACLRFEWTAEGISAVASGTSLSIVGTGAATVSYNAGINQYTVNVPVTTMTATLPIEVLGAFPNFEIAFQGTYGGCCGCGTSSGGTSGPITITGSGIANVTGTDPTFNVDVAAPAFIGTSGVTVSGVWPNITITGPGVIPGGGVNSVTGSPKILIGGSGANPTVSLVPTGIGAVTISGITFDNYGTATAVNSAFAPITTVTTTTPALIISPSPGSVQLVINDATTSAKGLIQLAANTAAASNNPADTTSAVSPAGVAAVLAGGGGVSSFSYTPDVAANYTNALLSGVTVPALLAGQTFIVTGYAEVFDSALPPNTVPSWGLGVFHGLTLLQGILPTNTGSHTITFTIVGPAAAQPITLKTTALSGTAVVPAQSLFGRLG